MTLNHLSDWADPIWVPRAGASVSELFQWTGLPSLAVSRDFPLIGSKG